MSKPKKIFCLIAFSLAGKDSIMKEVIKQNKQVKPIISHTTRPMRVNECEGREYYFIDKEEFFKMDAKELFIEKRLYHTKVNKDGNIIDDTWYYGFSKEKIEENEYGIAIIDADGYYLLKGIYGEDIVVPIYIEVDLGTLKNRAIKRKDLEEEVTRRLNDDKVKFKYFIENEKYETVYNENGKLDKAVEEVCGIINKHMEE